MTKEQKLPKWFNGEVYTKGGTVENIFTKETYKLNALELSMYDFIIGAQMAFEGGFHNNKIISDFHKALSWFRSNNSKAYMVLLD